jgi:putative NIF3 family GTP cyclohydrolase 1 type 2
MTITRRSFLASTAAFTVTPLASQQKPAALTAGQVVERIKAKVGVPWMADTVDKIVAGSPGTPVKGIATTMMATIDVLQRAAASGKNMIVTHEPTFYSHRDTTDALTQDATYRFKRELIAKNQIAIFRFHDHWHRMSPDGIAVGMARELGWDAKADPKSPHQFRFPGTPLQQLVKEIEAQLKVKTMRVVGDPKMPVTRVLASWGYTTLMPGLINQVARPEIDAIVIGETHEWELVEYVRDQIASGLKKALIVINHVVSEQAGMKYCAEWLKPIVSEVPIEFVPAAEPFWHP